MQYSVAAVIALAASTAAAGYTNGTVVYTTEVHTAYTTVCPASTELTFNGVTYTATASTTLTITNCPCTIVKPVTTSSVVYCNTWYPNTAPMHAAPSPAPVYPNGTTPAATTPAAAPPAVGTGVVVPAPSATPSTISASSGNKAFAFSGASLAGLLGLAAYIL
ncbi:putative Clock-controlled protein 6 [Glarea lozoyensis 74030]|uniref:Putative Clock-controlled protein 6 n=1 Tax=Glarea lozoyensis (strain ATCC 74030 / MF5533) TaxID=1104152 RepID=H0EXH8_GLAL7|nr:putative Clock-controlled protein 6 [Glarea lozoyensis 74030]